VRLCRILLRKTSLRLSCGLRPCAGSIVPVQLCRFKLAKKGRQSLLFFGVKATKPQDHAGFTVGFHGLKAKLALPSNPD
jgi:hypothetical protein